MELQQFNILNKTKTFAFSNLKFWQKVCFIIIDMHAKYLCDHQNGFWENLFFGSPEKLLWISYTIRIRQRTGVSYIEMKTYKYKKKLFIVFFGFQYFKSLLNLWQI
jgi:hypothetical protein